MIESVSEQHQARKIAEFTEAIERYHRQRVYQHLEKLVSIGIVALQGLALLGVIYTYQKTPWSMLFLSLITAYIAADFFNGLVHMYMDNNTHYTSIVGPYIAAFHLHHAKYTYQIRHPLKVYFFESGTKFWLLLYLIVLMMLQWHIHFSVAVNLGLVAFGIFSSLAEVSHYWCHHSAQAARWVQWLQRNRILLSTSHHKAHHHSDNVQYAFLNGCTDLLLNCISRYCFQGYKNRADEHAKAYMKTRVMSFVP